MGLPDLYYPPPGEEGWREFWFNHYNDHLEIIQKLQKLGFTMIDYIIYPWTDTDKEGILDRHQQFHNDFNLIVGRSGSDLSDFDEKNENEIRAWTYLNYEEHLALHQALGI